MKRTNQFGRVRAEAILPVLITSVQGGRGLPKAMNTKRKITVIETKQIYVAEQPEQKRERVYVHVAEADSAAAIRRPPPTPRSSRRQQPFKKLRILSQAKIVVANR